jgi:hypothetical protein
MNKTGRAALFFLTISVPCLTLACGGDEKKGPRSPESNSGITETSAKEDMPPPPAKTGDGATATDVKPEGQGAAGGMLKIAAMKVTTTKTAKGAPKPVEVKADGTIVVDGKAAAKIKGDQVDSTEGTSMVTIGVSGGLVGNGVKSGFKFEGDDLVSDDGLKVTVGEDGAITATKDGKSETFAKAEGGAAARRTALVVAVLWMNVPTGPQPDKQTPGDKPKPTAKPPAKK